MIKGRPTSISLAGALIPLFMLSRRIKKSLLLLLSLFYRMPRGVVIFPVVPLLMISHLLFPPSPEGGLLLRACGAGRPPRAAVLRSLPSRIERVRVCVCVSCVNMIHSLSLRIDRVRLSSPIPLCPPLISAPAK